jgi:hypothetical protein
MALVVTRIAPALLASVAATLLVVSARAETPATPAAADCLAKPNEPSAKGSHWYYRVAHPSGRHCWYQRPVDAAQDAASEAPAHPRTRTATAAPPPPLAAPAAPSVSDTSASAAAPSADSGASVVPPIAAPIAPIAAPTAAPYGMLGGGVMPAAPPAAAPSTPMQPVASAAPTPVDSALSASVQPQAATQVATLAATPQPPPDVVAPKPAPVRSVSAARQDEYADPASHVPALFGAVSALVIIILGSFVGRFLGDRRDRRALAALRAHDQRASVSSLPDSPALVPAMAAAGKVVRETAAPWPESATSPDDWGLRRSRKPRRAAPPAAPIREATRVLEDNVRALLGRLQSDLRGAESRPLRAASAAADARVPTARELDAVLAIWRAKRGAR